MSTKPTIVFDFSLTASAISPEELDTAFSEAGSLLVDKLAPRIPPLPDQGWRDLAILAQPGHIAEIQDLAKEIRSEADLFVLVGVGGSNQGARAVIESIGDHRVKVVYSGNSLSPSAMNSLIAQLEGKSVYVNVIAKNFATLEPGVAFRVLRHWLEDRYGKAGAARRIIATGTPGASLEAFSRKNGYRTLPFPQEIGGRFSVLSAVGLLPIAVVGVDVTAFLEGARSVQSAWESDLSLDNPVIRYALTRNVLYTKGFRMEILAHFEPCLSWFAKWWIQLFGESEGKQGSGIYPSSCSFSEDLHALGQYIQEGPRTHSETFIDVADAGSFPIPLEAGDDDGFGYVDGKDFALLNRIAFQSTVEAHSSGGVPCTVIHVPRLDAAVFGQLFMAFELACYLSASLFGVNPFDQPGVEAYKNAMSARLGRP